MLFLYVLITLVSFVFLYLSGLTRAHFLMPTTKILSYFSLSNASFEVNPYYFLLFLITIPLPSLLFINYLIKTHADYSIMPTFGAISFFILLVAGLNWFGACIALGFALSNFFLIKSVKYEKHIYKFLAVQRIRNHAIKQGLRTYSYFIVAGLLLTMFADPSYVESEMSFFFKTTFGEQGNFTSLDEYMMQQQKELYHQTLDTIEDSLLASIYSTYTDLNYQQRDVCYNDLQKNMDEIDKRAKESVDIQIEKQNDSLTKQRLGFVMELFRMIKNIYPLLTIATFLFLFQFFIFIFSFLTYVYSFVWDRHFFEYT